MSSARAQIRIVYRLDRVGDAACGRRNCRAEVVAGGERNRDAVIPAGVGGECLIHGAQIVRQ